MTPIPDLPVPVLDIPPPRFSEPDDGVLIPRPMPPDMGDGRNVARGVAIASVRLAVNPSEEPPPIRTGMNPSVPPPYGMIIPGPPPMPGPPMSEADP